MVNVFDLVGKSSVLSVPVINYRFGPTGIFMVYTFPPFLPAVVPFFSEHGVRQQHTYYAFGENGAPQ